MPNKPRRDKQIRSALHRGARTRPGADSVKSLLARSGPVMASIADQASRQRAWRKWLEERLPAGLAARVTGVVERDGELVIFTESAGWGVRLRYALAELDAELRRGPPALERVVVRVLPKGSPG